MIVVIDYEAGNLYNVANALDHLGVPFEMTDDAEKVRQAEKVILPGVGSARAAMESLRRAGLVEPIRGLTVPFLGICLGMQLLFESSEEEECRGLGMLSGSVRRFDNSCLKVPHVGWNQVELQADSPRPAQRLFEGIGSGGYFYFVHSYFAPREAENALTVTEYGAPFCSAAARDNFWGVQFHPERSGRDGLRLLANFLEVEAPC